MSHQSLRLIRAYRGYKAGDVIQATPNLADTLQRDGIAVPEHQTTFLPAQAAERAVESRSTVETRGGPQ